MRLEHISLAFAKHRNVWQRLALGYLHVGQEAFITASFCEVSKNYAFYFISAEFARSFLP